MYIIYYHRNKINNKFYIGRTCQPLDKRWRNGEGYKNQSKFYGAIQKYGWAEFEHGILEENLTLEEANKKEQYYIKKYNSIDRGYNIQPGGKNHSITEDIKNKISETKKSQHLHMSEEEKQRRSKMYSGKGNPFYGRRHSEETKEKMSKNHANVKGGANALAKAVKCIETGEIFPSARKAAEFCSRSKSAITNCLSGRSKSAGGYHWIRVEKEGE